MCIDAINFVNCITGKEIQSTGNSADFLKQDTDHPA